MEERELTAIKQMVKDGVISQEVATSYFPELAESEDERIRKELIEYFRWNVKQILNDFSNKECVAWLEKQGEQKQEWSEEDEQILNGLIKSLTRIAASTRTDSTSVNYTFARELEWLRSLRPQSHWKPTKEQMYWFRVAIDVDSKVRASKQILESLYDDLTKL